MCRDVVERPHTERGDTRHITGPQSHQGLIPCARCVRFCSWREAREGRMRRFDPCEKCDHLGRLFPFWTLLLKKTALTTTHSIQIAEETFQLPRFQHVVFTIGMVEGWWGAGCNKPRGSAVTLGWWVGGLRTEAWYGLADSFFQIWSHRGVRRVG